MENGVFGTLGIGTSSPGYKLDVSGTTRIIGAVGINGGLPGDSIGGQVTGLSINGYTNLAGIRINGGDAGNTIYQSGAGQMNITTAGSAICLTSTNTGACNQLFLAANAGNVGRSISYPLFINGFVYKLGSEYINFDVL